MSARLGNHRIQDQRIRISLAHGGQVRRATFSRAVRFLSLHREGEKAVNAPVIDRRLERLRVGRLGSGIGAVM
jgi:hypothetical protein